MGRTRALWRWLRHSIIPSAEKTLEMAVQPEADTPPPVRARLAPRSHIAGFSISSARPPELLGVQQVPATRALRRPLNGYAAGGQ